MTIRELLMASMMSLVLGGCSMTFMGTPNSAAPSNNYGYGMAGKPISSVGYGHADDRGKPLHRGSASRADDDDVPPVVKPTAPQRTKPTTHAPQRTKPTHAPQRTKPTRPDTRPDPADVPTPRPSSNDDPRPTRPEPTRPSSTDKPTRRPVDPNSIDKPTRRPLEPSSTKPTRPQLEPSRPVSKPREGATLAPRRVSLQRAPVR